MKEQNEKQSNGKAKQGKFIYWIFAILLIINSVQIFNLSSIVGKVDKYNQGVVDELGGIRGDVMSFGNDLNEIRSFLLLPTKNYSFDKNVETQESSEEKQTSPTELAIYSYLGQIQQNELIEKNGQQAEKFIENLKTDPNFQTALTQNELKLGKSENNSDMSIIKVTDLTDQPLFSINIDKAKNKLSLLSILENKQIQSYPENSASGDILIYLATNKEKVKQLKLELKTQEENLKKITDNSDLQKLLNDKKLSFISSPEETDKAFIYKFVNQDQQSILAFEISKPDFKLTFSGKTYQQINDLVPSLISAINNLQNTTPEAQMISDRKAELQQIFQQAAFKDILKNSNLTVSTEPRTDYNKLLYDVKSSDGKVVFSFTIELSSGLFKILKDNQEIDLNSLLENQEGSKKKP